MDDDSSFTVFFRHHAAFGNAQCYMVLNISCRRNLVRAILKKYGNSMTYTEQVPADYSFSLPGMSHPVHVRPRFL